MPYKQIMHILASHLAKNAELDEHVFVTRLIGKRFFQVFMQRLKEMPEVTTVILDFVGITIMDASFSDEVFGSFISSVVHQHAPYVCLVLQSLTSSNQENVEMALTSRPLREPGLRNCAVLVLTMEGNVILVGKVEAHVQQTFEWLAVRQQVTTRGLANALQLDIAAASTRLKVLYDLGFALRLEERDEHGKQYVYEWPL